MSRKKNLHQLFANSFGTDLGDRWRAGNDRVPRRRIDLKSKNGREPDRAKHPQPILGKTLRRIADGADHATLEVGATIDEIDDLFLFRIEEHSVDGEIAPGRVFLRRREMDFNRSEERR